MKIGILKKEEVEEYIKHEKAWGYELWIHNEEDYCAKILHFNKDAKFIRGRTLNFDGVVVKFA